MILVVALLGHEIIRIEWGQPAAPRNNEPHAPEEHHHLGGQFELGFQPDLTEQC